MDVEVVAAGVAANELRDDGDECGEKNDRGAGEVAQARRTRRIARRGKSNRRSFDPVAFATSLRMTMLWVGRIACSPVPSVPWFLFFHGSRRNVWRVWAATATGVNGSAKVVPLYQSFH